MLRGALTGGWFTVDDVGLDDAGPVGELGADDDGEGVVGFDAIGGVPVTSAGDEDDAVEGTGDDDGAAGLLDAVHPASRTTPTSAAAGASRLRRISGRSAGRWSRAGC